MRLDPSLIPAITGCTKLWKNPKILMADSLAGLSVALVAFPLSMALAIASGATPAQGLITAIVAGFIIALFSGSRFQIGGPAGAFIVLVYQTISQFGYNGLLQATLMGAGILVLLGVFKLGRFIHRVPHVVVTGFTAGIGAIIFASQWKDMLGLKGKMPPEFLEKMHYVAAHAGRINWAVLAIGLSAMLVLILFQKYKPQWPRLIIVVLVFAAALAVLGWGFVPTVGQAFPHMPSSLPMPSWPEFDWGMANVLKLLPSAVAIGFLAGIESLLCAVVADRMTHTKHSPNIELIAQGLANMASVCFGGLPATGTIARTGTNIRAGAQTPLAGMLHAIFVLLMLWAFAPYVAYVPLVVLAAILVLVAWNIAEVDQLKHWAAWRWFERASLVATFGLTVFADLVVAIVAGLVIYFVGKWVSERVK